MGSGAWTTPRIGGRGEGGAVGDQSPSHSVGAAMAGATPPLVCGGHGCWSCVSLPCIQESSAGACSLSLSLSFHIDKTVLDLPLLPCGEEGGAGARQAGLTATATMTTPTRTTTAAAATTTRRTTAAARATANTNSTTNSNNNKHHSSSSRNSNNSKGQRQQQKQELTTTIVTASPPPATATPETTHHACP